MAPAVAHARTHARLVNHTARHSRPPTPYGLSPVLFRAPQHLWNNRTNTDVGQKTADFTNGTLDVHSSLPRMQAAVDPRRA